MRYTPRLIQEQLLRASRSFPALILTGPRRSGKTTLFKKLFPKASYYLLEDPDIIGRFRADPKGFLSEIKTPVILDEIQNIPELFNYIRSLIDRRPHHYAQWLLTGSQEAPLMRGVSESMAGRAAIFQMMPFSISESSKVSLFRGGFPEVLAYPQAADIWFRSYIQTYLERDIRSMAAIKNLATFRRFLSILASRSGQMLNKTDIAAPLGVSVPTVGEWLNLLETTSQIILVPPFYENFWKRLIKSPKLYFADTGLACYLLGIKTLTELKRSTFYGPIFESFVATEIIKHKLNQGEKNELYYFRDQQGLEVDFLIPGKKQALILVEAKATATPTPQSVRPMISLSSAIRRYRTRSFIVHSDLPKTAMAASTIAPEVKAVTVKALLEEL